MNPHDFSDQWPVIPARPDLSQHTAPGCPRFDDVYFSRDGGFFESAHVFVQPAGFEDRLAGCKNPKVLELGFGTGRNFLTTLWYFLRHSPADATLHYVGFEQYPLDKTVLPAIADQLKALSHDWLASEAGVAPDNHAVLMAVLKQLHRQWPDPVPGLHRRILNLHADDGRIRLTLVLGDANRWLAQLDGYFDAVYLDGFAPSKNSALWGADLLAQIYARCQPGARVMTYSAARLVRDHLDQAGFRVERVAGFGRKRHSVIAHKADTNQPVDAPCASEVDGKSIAVIGAGFAGVSMAWVLAQRGFQVDLFEQQPHPANGGSGNPAGLIAPVISRDFNTLARLTSAGVGLMRSYLQQSVAAEHYRFNGVYKLARNERHRDKQQNIAHQLQPDARFAHWGAVRVGQAPDSDMGWHFPNSGWLRPRAVIQHWLAASDITCHWHTQVAQIQSVTDTTQRLADEHCQTLGDYAGVVVACAEQTEQLLPELGRWLEPCRGQLTLAPVKPEQQLTSNFMREGYVIDLPEGKRLFGASFKPGCAELTPKADEDQENIERLASIDPRLTEALDASPLEHRVAIRATTPDRLPMVGAVRPGVYLHTGHGARGLSWSLLLSEYLAGLINHEPSPLLHCDQQALDPQRFDARAARKAARRQPT